jgi:hypothetical protein
MQLSTGRLVPAPSRSPRVTRCAQARLHAGGKDGKEKDYVGTCKLEGDKLSPALNFDGARLDSPQRFGKRTDTEMAWAYENDSDTFVRAKRK